MTRQSEIAARVDAFTKTVIEARDNEAEDLNPIRVVSGELENDLVSELRGVAGDAVEDREPFRRLSAALTELLDVGLQRDPDLIEDESAGWVTEALDALDELGQMDWRSARAAVLDGDLLPETTRLVRAMEAEANPATALAAFDEIAFYGLAAEVDEVKGTRDPALLRQAEALAIGLSRGLDRLVSETPRHDNVDPATSLLTSLCSVVQTPEEETRNTQRREAANRVRDLQKKLGAFGRSHVVEGWLVTFAAEKGNQWNCVVVGENAESIASPLAKRRRESLTARGHNVIEVTEATLLENFDETAAELLAIRSKWS